MPSFVDASPPASSHIETLRKVGYKFTTAIGDIVDNSIAAKAAKIEIFFLVSGDVPYLEIRDNGSGMTPDELVENMSIGCKDPLIEREPGDLGRFGSGLKTASFSQARKLTVITRAEGKGIAAASWDIDRVVEKNSWCLEVLDKRDIDDLYPDAPSKLDETGAIVRWDKISAVVDDIHAPPADAQISSLLEDLHRYLGTYYHRFLTGKGRCSISINGKAVEPLDPFMRDILGYQEGPSTELRGRQGKVSIKTHILPPFNMMSHEQIAKYGGTAEITEKQGLYIYREKRLIVEGGWQGLTRLSQLAGLARIQIDVPATMDLEWSTDVKKSSLILPPKIKSRLKNLIFSPIKKSRSVHVYGGKKEVESDYWLVIENEREKYVAYEANPQNETLHTLMKTLDSAGQKRVANYLAKLCSSIPLRHIYSNMSEKPKEINQGKIDEIDTIEAWLERAMGNGQ